MAILDIVGKLRAVQWTGANNAEVISAITVRSIYIYSVVNTGLTTGSTLCIDMRWPDPSTGTGNVLCGQMYVPLNSWVVCNDSVFGVDASEFSRIYTDPSTMAAAMAGTTGFTAAVQSAITGNSGAFGSYPNLTVNGLSNANFDVPIRPMMPNNTFTAVPVLTGSASLRASLSITGLTSGAFPSANTANKLSTTISGVTWYDRVRINVANSGALQLAGAALLVHVTP